MKRKNRNIESLESRTLLSSAGNVLIQPNLDIKPQATGTAVSGLTPAQVKKAYGFDQVTFSGSTVKADGTGQTIAIIDAYNDPDITSDLQTFDRKFSLSDPTSFKVVGETGGSTSGIQTDAGWSTEIALDVEWAHAIAPKANILLVEAKSDSITDLMAGVNYARGAAGVSVVSLSWGGSEFFGETSYDKDFTTPTGHQGVTFVAASGDEGSGFFGGAEWPAVSPNVLSVGGTELSVKDSTGTYGSENAWRDSSGGISRFEKEPAYQDKVQDTGGKTSPDVSYDADPMTGFAVYSSVSDGGYKGWQEVGGTSAGTPQWGALVAIADQGRKLAGKSSLDGATGTLPALYSLSLSDFHDVSSGRSGRLGASTGYDLVTGLGSPKANTVVGALIGGSISSAVAKTSNSTATTPSFSHKIIHGGPWGAEFHDPGSMPAPAPTEPVSSPIGKAPGSSGSSSSGGTTTTTTTTTITLSQTQAAALGFTVARKIIAGVQAANAAVTVVDVAAVAAAKAAANTIDPSPSAALSSTHLGGGVSAIFSTLAIDPTGHAARHIAGEMLGNVADGLAAGSARLARAAFNDAGPLNRTFHFERLGDPMTLVADAAATFADESALLGNAVANNRYTKAWAVTFSVIAADAAVVLYWAQSRKRSRVRSGPYTFDLTGGEIE